MNRYELLPKYDRAKSFYGKAHVEVDGDKKTLISYETAVCRIDGDGFHRLWKDYSVTTMRHVNEFSIQNGFGNVGKAKWDKMKVDAI